MDSRDAELVAALLRCCRTPLEDVALDLGVSVAAVHKRLVSLEERDIVRRHRCLVNPARLGARAVRLRGRSTTTPTRGLADAVGAHPCVFQVTLGSGAHIGVTAIVRGRDDEDSIKDHLSRHGVDAEAPRSFYLGPTVSRPLDRDDCRIMAEMSYGARRPLKSVAARVGLRVNLVSQRVSQLVDEAGILFTIDLDTSAGAGTWAELDMEGEGLDEALTRAAHGHAVVLWRGSYAGDLPGLNAWIWSATAGHTQAVVERALSTASVTRTEVAVIMASYGYPVWAHDALTAAAEAGRSDGPP
jgi:DNA-binding Lrp family transcriptional regulator